MGKMNTNAKRIIALAYFHRYGWMAVMFACIGIWTEQMLYILSTACIMFAIWSFIGYICKWKHIYCSYQNAYHKKMTPNAVYWNQIKKSDAYAIPLIFIVLGIALLIISITS